VFDIHRNEAVVAIGISHDTAEFAVAAIRLWWTKLGKEQYTSSKRLLITADSGGSNAARSRLWKLELQRLADDTGLLIEVCHYPPGTSKWNKIGWWSRTGYGLGLMSDSGFPYMLLIQEDPMTSAPVRCPHCNRD